jgi:Ca-activated chloride channel family protein
MTRAAVAFALALTSLAALASSARANGILTAGRDGGSGEPGLVTLQSHAVTAEIRDAVATVTVEQVFLSRATVPLEGTYVFPLPEGAVVSDFAMTMSGRMVKGEVVEAQKARAIYEGIVRRHRDPGLLEYLGRGIYQARVFPIAPREPLTIRLSFQQVLREDSGTLEFRYPLATERLNGTPVGRASVLVGVESAVDLKAIYSPTHHVAITRDGERKAVASFEQAGGRQAEDFLLYVGRSPDALGFTLLSHKEPAEDGTFMAILAPRNEVDESKRPGQDVVFVLDTSGSMAGEKIEQARRALSYGVSMLDPRDRFGIIRFATTVQAFRDELAPATPEVRRAATDWIEALTAEGGTDIDAALTTAAGLARADRRCMVVLLTDGRPTVGVTAAEQLLANVRKANRHQARIFTFGVGYDLDVRLLDLLAEESEGTRDYVAPREDIEIVTSRFFHKVRHPVLTDARLDLGPGLSDVYPREIGDLFAGSQVVVFGRYREAGERTVVLTGTLDGEAVRHEFVARFGAESGPAWLERLWANRKVAFLLDQIRLHGAHPELVTEVVRLATRHAIVTPYTSGLVVEEEELDGTDDQVFTDSDQPFEGPAHGSVIGVGGGGGNAFRGRGGNRDLGTGGGAVPRHYDAQDEALRWLAAHQQPDGSWSAADYEAICDGRIVGARGEDPGRGRAGRDLHVTAPSLLAFLGAGYTNRGSHPYAKVVKQAAQWLKDRQDPEGGFVRADDPDGVVANSQAAQALVELYGMTGSPIWKRASQAAIEKVLLSRRAEGVWGRTPASSEADLRATAWAVSALHAASLVVADRARRRQPPTFGASGEVLAAVRAWLEGVTDATTGEVVPAALPDPSSPGSGDALQARRTRAATAAWLWILLGEDPARSERVRGCLRILSTDEEGYRPSDEESHFGSLVSFQVGDEVWSAWRTRRLLEDRVQHRDGDYCVRKGSVDPRGPRAAEHGRVGATALFALDLSVMHRFPRGTRVLPGVARPSPLPSEAGETQESEDLKRRKAAASAGDVRDAGHARSVAGKTFVKAEDGRWLDTAWNRSSATVRIEALSDAYFDLVGRAPEVPRWLALGSRLVVVVDGTAYEIVPAP